MYSLLPNRHWHRQTVLTLGDASTDERLALEQAIMKMRPGEVDEIRIGDKTTTFKLVAFNSGLKVSPSSGHLLTPMNVIILSEANKSVPPIIYLSLFLLPSKPAFARLESWNESLNSKGLTRQSLAKSFPRVQTQGSNHIKITYVLKLHLVDL